MRSSLALASLCSTMRAQSLSGVAHHAAVSRRVAQLRGADGEPLRRRRHQPRERAGTHERHVAVQHQHLRAARHPRQRLRQRMSGAQLLRLLDPRQVRARKCSAHVGAAVAVHDEDLRGIERSRRIEHVREQRSAG
jgi:hypothetical protein